MRYLILLCLLLVGCTPVQVQDMYTVTCIDSVQQQIFHSGLVQQARIDSVGNITISLNSKYIRGDLTIFPPSKCTIIPNVVQEQK